MPNVQPAEFPPPTGKPVRPALNQLAETKRFMLMRGKTVNTFNPQQTTETLGVMLQAVELLLLDIMAAQVTPTDQRSAIFQCSQWVSALSKEFLGKEHYGDVLRADREELLLSMLAIGELAYGAALSYGLDVEGAFREINHTREHYPATKPDMAPYVRPLDEDR